MSRYDHKIETSLEGIEHLSKEKKEKKERKEQKPVVYLFGARILLPKLFFHLLELQKRLKSDSWDTK
jgi:hypothetical protein